MTKRENLLSLFRRKGYQEAPVDFALCPYLKQVYHDNTGSSIPYETYFDFPWRGIQDLPYHRPDDDVYRSWYPFTLLPGVVFDRFGVAHEPGSAAAMHMTRMRHPLAGVDSLDRMQEYPLPVFDEQGFDSQMQAVHANKSAGLASVGNMACTIWETSWYIRSMEDLMMDMAEDDPKAHWLLDRITDLACQRAAAFAKSGVDILSLGDDIGMQSRTMMSQSFYQTWLKPRLARVIQAAKSLRPELLVMYHSCGFIEPFIPDLIEVGVDILNPVQPESMKFKALHERYGDCLSFHGTIGTQSTLPFGSPEDVRHEVHRNLSIAGNKGGLFCAPTHMVEPEVPWENIVAYVEACRSFMP